ncbi:MAG: radical SAM protein [Elusimicrobiales bacterium]|nr:radical SAM protein [Elusimicrobiales bacterium]
MKINYQKAISLIDSYELMCYPPHYPVLYTWEKTKGYPIKKLKSEIFRFKNIGIYINIPFCPSKCSFCFLKVYEYRNRKLFNDFINGLELEVKMYAEILKNSKISSVYLAGGTVTVLNEKELEKIFILLKKNFNISYVKQITVETSADFLNENKLKILKDNEVNLLMIGIQTFDDNVIKNTNRIQNNKKIKEKIELIKKYSIPFNVDIICGLTTFKNFIKDIKMVLDLKPDLIHINKIKPINNSEFKKKVEVMQKNAIDFISSYGYKKIDEESLTLNGIKNIQGDMDYLLNHSIIGLGPNSMGHIYGKYRYKNYVDINKYYNHLKKNNLPWEILINLTEKDEIDFYLLTKIPINGLNEKTLKKRYPSYQNYIEKKIKKMKKEKLIDNINNKLIMISNNWFKFTKSIYNKSYIEILSNLK